MQEEIQMHQLKKKATLPVDKLVEIAANNKVKLGEEEETSFEIKNGQKLGEIEVSQYQLLEVVNTMYEYPSLLKIIDAKLDKRRITHIEIRFYTGEKPRWEFNRSTTAVLYINQ